MPEDAANGNSRPVKIILNQGRSDQKRWYQGRYLKHKNAECHQSNIVGFFHSADKEACFELERRKSMSWIASVFSALLTGVVGFFVAGAVAVLCVGWYRISGFEGGAGYFVVLTAILGGIVSFFLGLIVTRLVGSGSGLAFLKGTAIAWGIVLGIGGVAALISFLLGDVPPKIDGRKLRVEVEIRLPVGETNPPANVTEEASLVLGSVVNHVQRKSETGHRKFLMRSSRMAAISPKKCGILMK
jgi:hypothetical protein